MLGHLQRTSSEGVLRAKTEGTRTLIEFLSQCQNLSARLARYSSKLSSSKLRMLPETGALRTEFRSPLAIYVPASDEPAFLILHRNQRIERGVD